MVNKVKETVMSQPACTYETFGPRVYLEEYYATLPSENVALIAFLVRAFAEVPKGVSVLEFGSGPTMFSALAAARRASRIHLSDFHHANRLELSMWLSGDEAAFDWSPYTRLMLQLEGQEEATLAVTKREFVTRGLVQGVFHCDATQQPSIQEAQASYDVLVSNMCLEAAACSYEGWLRCLRNATAPLRSGGKLVLTSVKGSRSYSVGEAVFPVLPLYESDLKSGLQGAGFLTESIVLETVEANHPVHAYDGLMFVTATKA
jgi:hypothetical protein